jgi:hypothetical protein
MKRPRTSLDLEAAETIAIAGLAFLAEDARRLGRFLAETGVGPEELRENVRAAHAARRRRAPARRRIVAPRFRR